MLEYMASCRTFARAIGEEMSKRAIAKCNAASAKRETGIPNRLGQPAPGARSEAPPPPDETPPPGA
jgi:hypothetical protein